MNLIKEAVESARDRNKELYTIPKIAIACGISEGDLYNYMSGCRLTPPDVIVALSAYLHDLGLRDRYCSKECAIGKCKNPNGYCERDLQTLGFMSGKHGKNLQDTFNLIYEMYSDGKRSREEELIFIENSAYLDQTREIIDNLINIREELKCKYL